MANICDYTMRVQGKKENVDRFYNWLSAHYDYDSTNEELKVYTVKKDSNVWSAKDENKMPVEHHIGYRVFEAYKDFENDTDSGELLMGISGDCAWSIYSSMFNDGIGTYMGTSGYGRDTDKAISIDNASKELGLKIEIFSAEPSMCFSEHYYIDNGEVVNEETTEFSEIWLDYLNKDNEEFDAEAYNELTDDFRLKVNEAIAKGEDFLMECDF